jgi:hypothetical protein
LYKGASLGKTFYLQHHSILAMAMGKLRGGMRNGNRRNRRNRDS